MATFTTNYNLRKPATSDFVDVVTDINNNMDTIDTQIKNRENDIATINAAWTAYTPTLTNFPAGTINRSRWKLNGKGFVYDFRFTCSGAAPGAKMVVSLPVTLHGSYGSASVLGVALILDNDTGSRYHGMCTYESPTSINFQPHGGFDWNGTTKPVALAVNDVFSFTIQGEIA